MSIRFRIYRYNLPLVRPLCLGAETIERRSGYLIEVKSWKGSGNLYGEASPLPGFSTENPADFCERLIECCAAVFHAEPGGAPSDAPGCGSPAARFGVACVLQDFPATLRDSAAYHSTHVEVNGLIADDGGDVNAEVARLSAAGFRTLKVKVGRDAFGREVDLLRTVSERLGGGIQLRLDANRAWPLEQAVEFCEGLRGLPVEYIEEPLRDPDQAVELKQRVAVSLAADESLRTNACPWADVYVVKPTLDPMALAHLRRAADEGKRAVISASYESGMGIGALASWAARYAACKGVACGLDTYSRLAEDLLDRRIPVRDGRIALADVAESVQSLNRRSLECVYDG